MYTYFYLRALGDVKLADGSKASRYNIRNDLEKVIWLT